MGGKHKQAQRTKGNVKPSSSARAAELLVCGSQSTSSLGFVGFDGLSDGLGYVPAAASGEEADSSINADFRIVLRKLSKKDATTKLKALQEFSSLCQEKDIEAIKSVLPFWPRVYNKVAIDHDRRVREASQQAFEQLVLRIRRNLAPYLKSLMGTWLVAQNDIYAPAASAAKSAFNAAFPPTKQTEALVFCKDEILSHLHENLVVHTAQTLSDLKTTEAEDMEAKYNRMLCASLNALKTFLSVVPPDHQKSLIDKYKLILNNNRFWKYAKHNQTMIQGSFYGVLSALCQHQPKLAREYCSKISPITLHNLDNTDPLVCRTLWEAVLCTVSTLEDCWKHVNLKKGLLPGLWRLLSAGGSGSASVIYPNLLPFLSQLPLDLRSDGVQFYKDFFDNMKTGLTTEKVRVSPSELDAIVQAFMECLQYTVSQNLTDPLITDFILNDELMPLMMSTLLEDTLPVCTTLYPKMVDLLTYFYKSSTDENGKRATAASTLLSSIIQSLKQLDIIEQDKEKYIKRYAVFLCTFKGKTLPSSRKTVRFSGGEEGKTLETLKKNQLDFPQVLDLVSDACKRAYRQSLSQKSLATLEFFNQVTKSYDVDNIFGVLWNTSYQDILGDVILPWMAEYDDLSQDNRVCQSFVGIITTLYHQCTATDKVLFLSKAIQCIQDVFMLHLFLQVVYSDITDKEVRDWFRGEEFGQRIVDVAKALCHQCSLTDGAVSDEQKTEAQWQLLKLAFTSDDKLEPLLDEKYLSVILGEIHGALPSPDTARIMTESEVMRCISFICDVSFNFFSNVKGCLSLPVAEALLLSLFQLSCQEQFAKTDGYAEKIRKTWQQGVDALIKQKGGLLSDEGFFHDAVEYIRCCLQEERCTLERLKTLTDVTLSLAQCVSHPLKKNADAAIFTDSTVLAFLGRVHQPMSDTDIPQWQMPVVLSHEITFESLPEMNTDHKPSDLIPRCIITVAYGAQLLSAVLKDHLANGVPVNTDVICAKQVCDIAFAVVLSDSLLHYQKQTSGNSTDLNKVNELLQTSLLLIIKNLPESAVNEMLQQMLERSMKEGNLWSLSLKVLLHEASKHHTVTDMLHINRDLEMFNELTEAKLHTLQVAVPYLDDATLSKLLDIQAEHVLLTTPDRIVTIPGCRSSLAILSKIIQNQERLISSQTGSAPVKHVVPLQTLLLVLSHIQTIRQEHEELFLFDCCVSEEQWQVVSFNIELMNFMKLLVENYVMQLTSETWDFILCSLIAWIQSCCESKACLSSELKTQIFAVTSFVLLKQVAENFSSTVQAHEEGCYDNLLTEWLEFFSEGIYSLLLPLFVEVAGGMQAIPSPSTSLMLSSLSSSACLCPVQHLRQNSLPMKLIAGDECHLPETYQTTLNHLCPLLLNPNRAVQLTAYRLLLSLMAELSQYDDKQDVADEDDKPARSPPTALMSSLLVSSEALNTVLHNVAIGERCEIDIESDEYVITMAYLLSWQLLLSLFRGAKVELRAEYAQYLRNNNLVEVLLDVLYKLMPENPVLQQSDSSAQIGAKEKSTKNMFEEEPSFDVQDVRKEVDILHMSCTVYFHALQDLPALIRHWYNSVDKRMSAIANRYTTKYVSPILCNLEIRAVQDANVKLDNMTIKTRPAAREVAATYTVEELTMELVVTLPNNHPLGQITVECGKRIGVASAQWRNWMLQLTTFLHRQNGSILDGLTLWRRNVNKRFEGVEECMICFSVIHGSNCQLPKLQCKTCKKRFHSACLYKWFNTSNNSSCPMCRNLF